MITVTTYKIQPAGKLILLVLLLAFSTLAHAQASLYSLASVPDVVKTNAEVIMHSEKIEVDIDNPDRTDYSVHQVYTVLNEQGSNALVFREFSSNDRTLTDAEIRVYDANGKQTARYKKKDMVTQAYGEGLISDGYVTWFRVQAAAYPVTLEVDYKMRMKGTFFLPTYYFMAEKQGVVSSEYTLRAPAEMHMRFKPVLTDIKPVVTTEGKETVYRWAVSSLPPYEYEPGSPAARSIPHVKVVSDQFSYNGYKGDFSTWKSFGSWYYDLCTGTDKLTPEREDFFRNMVKDAVDSREKVRRIYTYMQENFRYVSIQLGVGGFRPMPASFTDKQKYGDCKGLSNFVKAALNAVGIPSCLALINRQTNGEPSDPDFPANNFNHAILCVPMTTDSIWLECTSTTAGFGELETSTENRNAVVVNEQGGFLINTPRSIYTANFIGSHVNVHMDEDLSALTETNYVLRGYYSELMNELNKVGKDDQKRYLVNYFGYKQPDDFVFVRNDRNNFTVRLAISKVPEFMSGDKMFINSRMSGMWTTKLPKSEKRKLDYYFDIPFEKQDTTVFILPAGSGLEVLPKDRKIETAYSLYTTAYQYDASSNSVTVLSTLILRENRIPAKDYESVKKFFDDVIADTQKIVVKRGEPSGKKAF